MELRIAGAQIAVTSDVEANLETLLRAVNFAREERADLLLTPEGSLSGYTPSFDASRVEEALERVVARAREAGVALALGTCFREPGDRRCYNQVRFYSRNGAFLGYHAKILRCGTLSAPALGEIHNYSTRPLRTFQVEGVTLGALICNDLWANPTCTPDPDVHLTQQLSAAGARVVLHAVNGGRDGSPMSELAWQYHEANLRLRALAGRLWIVTVDNCHPPHLPCSAPSGVISPRGEWVFRTRPVGEHLFVCTLSLDESEP